MPARGRPSARCSGGTVRASRAAAPPHWSRWRDGAPQVGRPRGPTEPIEHLDTACDQKPLPPPGHRASASPMTPAACARSWLAGSAQSRCSTVHPSAFAGHSMGASPANTISWRTPSRRYGSRPMFSLESRHDRRAVEDATPASRNAMCVTVVSENPRKTLGWGCDEVVVDQGSSRIESSPPIVESDPGDRGPRAPDAGRRREPAGSARRRPGRRACAASRPR
jgi:hypothetical protein